MTPLLDLWLPILLSAAFIFVASSIIHMMLPIHQKDYAKFPDEDRIRDALRGIPAGQYMFPCADSMKEWQSPEMQKKVEEGPVGIAMIKGPGTWGMGPALAKWFVFTIVVSVFCAYLTGLVQAPGADGMAVFRFTGTIAFLGYAFAQFHEWTWKGLNAGIMIKFMIDGTIYALITAGTFAWLWPAAA